jgi:putative hemolysin
MRNVSPESSHLLNRPAATGNESLLDRMLLLRELKCLCHSAAEHPGGATFFDALLKNLNLSYVCADTDLRRIPARGPVVVVANHPYGLADGVILGSLLLKIRPDIKFMANSLLASAELEASRNYIIPVNPFSGPESARANRKGVFSSAAGRYDLRSSLERNRRTTGAHDKCADCPYLLPRIE